MFVSVVDVPAVAVPVAKAQTYDGVPTKRHSVPNVAGNHVVPRFVTTPVNGSNDLKIQAAIVQAFIT